LSAGSLYPARTECARREFSPGRRLRIGFVSTYFLCALCRPDDFGSSAILPRDRFEVLRVRHALRRGDLAEAIRKSADRLRAAPARILRPGARPRSIPAALDMVFFTDIGMHPLTLFPSRSGGSLAIQMGHLGTFRHQRHRHDRLYCSANAIEAAGSEQ